MTSKAIMCFFIIKLFLILVCIQKISFLSLFFAPICPLLCHFLSLKHVSSLYETPKGQGQSGQCHPLYIYVYIYIYIYICVRVCVFVCMCTTHTKHDVIYN